MAFGDLVSSLSYAHLGVLLSLLAVYTLYGAIWRLYFSPVSHIPGPRLAALTWWYEFYYDIILGGQYVFKIIELHKEYGPIIRINPSEVHIGDPDFFPQLYPASNKRRDRWRFFTKQFGADGSGVGTIDHDLHKLRRSAINPFFSMQNVRSLQPVIEERVDALLARLSEDGRTSEKPIDVLYPFSAFTNDVINEYAFSKCDHLIEDPTYGKDVTDYLLTGTHYGKAIQHMEIILKLINALPEKLSAALVPGWRGFLKMKNDIRQQIAEIKATEKTEKWQLDVSHPTIFHELLSSPALPPSEKTLVRLSEEGQVLVQAGTLTVSWALAIATFHLLSQPALLSALRTELTQAMADPHAEAPLLTLESLPLLRAIVKETLRHSLGSSGRLARVCPDETLFYKTTPLPAGVPIAMTTYQTVTTASIYPSPQTFDANRWLTPDPAELQRLDRYLTVFSAGGRACLGMWLAQAELTLALAKLWRVWGGEGDRRRGDVGVMRLFETTARDARMAADYFIPIPWKGTKGVRVVFETFQE
ncbi:cytochrome P450 [Lasiosphaeris hirsuta]|uniref:Cytochrome P450 n=1 Tax=Lasiosphaeris hirsuta TaxID=260670 RepID=A0AA40B8U3_9PEZI|nr:cytochrome P450 [Lasiosphaeris hirsuta]